jgi:hypothetical protein
MANVNKRSPSLCEWDHALTNKYARRYAVPAPPNRDNTAKGMDNTLDSYRMKMGANDIKSVENETRDAIPNKKKDSLLIIPYKE